MKIMKKDDIQLSIFQFIKSMINNYKEKRKILRFYKIYWEYNDYIEYLSYELYILIEINEKYEEILNDWIILYTFHEYWAFMRIFL